MPKPPGKCSPSLRRARRSQNSPKVSLFSGSFLALVQVVWEAGDASALPGAAVPLPSSSNPPSPCLWFCSTGLILQYLFSSTLTSGSCLPRRGRWTLPSLPGSTRKPRKGKARQTSLLLQPARQRLCPQTHCARTVSAHDVQPKNRTAPFPARRRCSLFSLYLWEAAGILLLSACRCLCGAVYGSMVGRLRAR